MAKLDDLIQQKQQRDEDWKSRKAAEREELGQLSDDAVMRVTSEPGAYLHYLDTQAINPRYSASNVMLAMAQNPEITYINSLEVWNRLGRSVNRDENGMKIRVSDTYVKDGREYHGYKIGRVFDISQTHGKAGVPALSLKDNTPEMDAALRRLLDSSPVPVVTSSTMYQDAVYDPKTQSITVNDYPDVMSIDEMCRALSIGKKTGYKLLQTGQIRFLKIGRAYRIPKINLLEYLQVIRPE